MKQFEAFCITCWSYNLAMTNIFKQLIFKEKKAFNLLFFQLPWDFFQNQLVSCNGEKENQEENSHFPLFFTCLPFIYSRVVGVGLTGSNVVLCRLFKANRL